MLLPMLGFITCFILYRSVTILMQADCDARTVVWLLPVAVQNHTVATSNFIHTCGMHQSDLPYTPTALQPYPLATSNFTCSGQPTPPAGSHCTSYLTSAHEAMHARTTADGSWSDGWSVAVLHPFDQACVRYEWRTRSFAEAG
jgi:hypothetical protein